MSYAVDALLFTDMNKSLYLKYKKDRIILTIPSFLLRFLLLCFTSMLAL